jgi:hypothetical protein
MSLSAAAKAAGYEKPTRRCLFGEILANLNADDLAFYEQMVADGTSRATIARVFQGDGYRVGRTTVKTHLGGDCSCP